VLLMSKRSRRSLQLAATLALVAGGAEAQTPAPPAPYAYPGYAPPAYYAPPPPPPPAPPAQIRYVEGRPIPPGYHLETQPRKGLVVTGAVLFGSMYAISASVAGSSKHDGDIYLLVPVAGPFIDMSTRTSYCATSSSSCDADGGTRFLLTFDALTQITGATLLAIGVATPRKILERDDAPVYGRDTSTFQWAFAPRSFRGGGLGVGWGGVF
jgi:hypothetical protein